MYIPERIEEADNTVYEIIAPCGMLRFIYLALAVIPRIDKPVNEIIS